jgi:hypothetical protein
MMIAGPSEKAKVSTAPLRPREQTTATTVYREMAMALWLAKAEAELREGE